MPNDAKEAEDVQQAVDNEIKRRRKSTVPADLPITLDERRAHDKANVTRILKEYGSLLPSWDDVLEALVQNRSSRSVERLKSVDDFIDGFELKVPDGLCFRQVQRILKEKGIDALSPQGRAEGRHWVQLGSGPYDLDHNLPILGTIVEDFRQMMPQIVRSESISDDDHQVPVLSKLDVTRDFAGSFFAPGNWKEKY